MSQINNIKLGKAKQKILFFLIHFKNALYFTLKYLSLIMKFTLENFTALSSASIIPLNGM